jgi:hypothetical protein
LYCAWVGWMWCVSICEVVILLVCFVVLVRSLGLVLVLFGYVCR